MRASIALALTVTIGLGATSVAGADETAPVKGEKPAGAPKGSKGGGKKGGKPKGGKIGGQDNQDVPLTSHQCPQPTACIAHAPLEKATPPDKYTIRTLASILLEVQARRSHDQAKIRAASPVGNFFRIFDNHGEHWGRCSTCVGRDRRKYGCPRRRSVVGQHHTNRTYMRRSHPRCEHSAHGCALCSRTLHRQHYCPGQ